MYTMSTVCSSSPLSVLHSNKMHMNVPYILLPWLLIHLATHCHWNTNELLRLRVTLNQVYTLRPRTVHCPFLSIILFFFFSFSLSELELWIGKGKRNCPMQLFFLSCWVYICEIYSRRERERKGIFLSIHLMSTLYYGHEVPCVLLYLTHFFHSLPLFALFLFSLVIGFISNIYLSASWFK